MADSDKHVVANDGTNWTSTPSPVDPEEKRKADEKAFEVPEGGQGPGATNEPR